MRYDFEWDPVKAAANRRKHGVGFAEASTVFLDPGMLSIFDDEHAATEDRWITLGRSATDRILVVCHTFREETETAAIVRVFSARKATARERQQYGG